MIARSIGSLMAQDYAGKLHVILVDDQSSDGTGDAARALGCEVLSGAPRPPGWDGKALGREAGHRAGRDAGLSMAHRCRYRAHAGKSLQAGRTRRADGLVLTSLMAKLSMRKSLAEKL